MERHQVHRKRKQSPVKIYRRPQTEVIEPRKPIDELPNLLVARVEDMRAIAMNVDAFDLLGKAVAADVIALVDQKHPPSVLRHDACKHRAEHAAADDGIIKEHRPTFS